MLHNSSMGERIKVVWICHLSNSMIRAQIHTKISIVEHIIRCFLRKKRSVAMSDLAQWNSQGISVIEKINDIELHIVSPYQLLSNELTEFESNGVFYHFFRNQTDSLLEFIKRNIVKGYHCNYKKNTKCILELLDRIKPDVIHLIGVENLHYALSILNYNGTTPIIAQLQTLVNDPNVETQYMSDLSHYIYMARLEKSILRKVDYIGTPELRYKELIIRNVCESAVLINTQLAISEPINKSIEDKKFDFVYFAANINKACDLAIEAFSIAYKINPTITLDIIGKYDNDFKKNIDKRILELGISHAITFEGMLSTHEDVIRQVRLARFALLPLKIDIISGTIRESMANGIPVITTITSGTPKLNENRVSALMSLIGDHEGMAVNMLRLLSDEKFAEKIKENAFITYNETIVGNDTTILKWVKAYHVILDNYYRGMAIPDDLLL